MHRDCTDEVAGRVATRPVLEDFTGPGRIVACTVLHDGAAPRAVVLADVEGGRTLAVSGDAALAARFESEEMIGAAVSIETAGTFRMTSARTAGAAAH